MTQGVIHFSDATPCLSDRVSELYWSHLNKVFSFTSYSEVYCFMVVGWLVTKGMD